jgi:hypothetical protein
MRSAHLAPFCRCVKHTAILGSIVLANFCHGCYLSCVPALVQPLYPTSPPASARPRHSRRPLQHAISYIVHTIIPRPSPGKSKPRFWEVWQLAKRCTFCWVISSRVSEKKTCLTPLITLILRVSRKNVIIRKNNGDKISFFS